MAADRSTRPLLADAMATVQYDSLTSTFTLTIHFARMQSTSPPGQNGPAEPISTRAVRQSRESYLQRKRTLTNVQSGMSKCWTQVQGLGATARQKCSLSIWLGIAATVVIGGLGLRYAYVQQILAYQSMRLAEWTAMKDFKEICREQAQTTTPLSHKCELILRDPFPEPPYIQPYRWKRWQTQHDNMPHPYTIAPGFSPVQYFPLTDAQQRMYSWTLTLTMGFLIFWHRRRLQQLLLGTQQTNAPAEPYNALYYSDNPSYREHSLQSAHQTGHVTTSIKAPARTHLRHRHAKIKHKPPATIWTAAEEGSVEEVERHLESGVDVNIHSTSRGTPLSVAAYHGRTNNVKLLLNHGADPCRRNSWYKENALQAAAEGGHEDVVGVLLDHGADMDAEICGLRAICIAAWRGHSNIVKVLLSRGAQEDFIKGLSTNGIVLAAHHANRVIIGGIMNLDTIRARRLRNPEPEGSVSDGDDGQPNLMDLVQVLATMAGSYWASRFDDSLEASRTLKLVGTEDIVAGGMRGCRRAISSTEPSDITLNSRKS